MAQSVFVGWFGSIKMESSASGTIFPVTSIFRDGATDILTISSTAVTSTVPGQFTALGVGVTPPSAGLLQVSGGVVGGYLQASAAEVMEWASRSRMSSPANALFNVTNSAANVGIQLNTGTAAPTFNNGTVGANSRNTAGTMTLTGANTGGTVTFGSPAFTNTPHCIITGTQATDNPYITAVSGSAFTVAGMTANGTFSFICIGGV